MSGKGYNEKGNVIYELINVPGKIKEYEGHSDKILNVNILKFNYKEHLEYYLYYKL